MKYFGKIGFWLEDHEYKPGRFKSQMVEKDYYGDVLTYKKSRQNNEQVNNNALQLNNEFSILADTFAQEHLGNIRYIVFSGIKWSVTNITINYPRLNISVGGEYKTNEDS